MIGPALAILLSGAGAGEPPMVFAQVIVKRSVIVKMSQARGPAPRPMIPLRERKGPKCVPMSAIAGAAIIEPSSVDISLRGGERVRARFSSSCPDLDYYGGFYVRPTEDGMLCADRDFIRARSGGECEIDRFRRLVPGKAKD